MIKGIAASNGIAIAKAYKLDMPDLTVTQTKVDNVDAEIAKLEATLQQVEADLLQIKEVAAKNLSEEEAQIFDAHILVLADPELKGQTIEKIKGEQCNADFAIQTVADTFAMMFEMMDDEYFRERAADVRDVTRRIIAGLQGKKLPNPSLINEEVVIIAHDLTPSDTAQLNKNLVKGFATNIGGRTSHSAILARSIEIPAVVATNTVTEDVNDGDLVILDGSEGVIIANPNSSTVTEYIAKRDSFIKYREELKALKDEKSVTTDNYHVELVANIGSPNDIVAVNENGAEGVGLYRTEFL